MSNIINFTEAQTKKLKEEKKHFDALISLFTKINEDTSDNSIQIIQDFLENSESNDKFLPLTLKLIASHNELKTHMEKILRILSYKDREQILKTIATLWPKDIETTNRLKHILKLSHFCAKQVPSMPFSQIIPRSIVLKFLMAPQRK